MDANLEVTEIFDKIWEELNGSKRVIMNQGGTRSGKTTACLQSVIVFANMNPNTSISIVRISMPALKETIIPDFKDIMEGLGIYDIKRHNKTEQLYTFKNGSTIKFLSAATAMRLKGSKRDILYVNEATELPHSAYLQLAMRTNKKILIDFNPEDNDHWIWDLINEDKTVLIKSTYKDNPFLSSELVQEIEDLIKVDMNYYKTYVLGERPTSNRRIYTHFKQYNSSSITTDDMDYVYGLDFGFNHPCALVKTSFDGNKVYVKEEIYRSKLTTSDLIMQMNEIGINKHSKIFCDSARPEIIEELKRAGYSRATKSDKNVKPGIDRVKSMEVFIEDASINLWKEYRAYVWKMNGERIIDEPVKLNDDGMDAMRYAIHSSNKNRKFNDFYTKIYKF